MLVTLIPLYQSEISPPHTRGLLVGMHGKTHYASSFYGIFAKLLGTFIGLGYALASWIGVGFYFVHNGAAQWRVPLALQCLPALFLAIGIKFMPESPRWRQSVPKVILFEIRNSDRSS